MTGCHKKRNKEEAEQHTIKFFEKLLRASSDGIVITDASHNIIVVNEAFCKFFGRRHCEVIETNLFVWLEQLGPESHKCWNEMVNHVYSEGSCHDMEFTITAHKEIRYLSVNASLMEKVDREEAGIIISIWRDISKQKRTEDELKILNKSLEQRIAERTAALVKMNGELLAKIEEQKLTEKALRRSENKYRILFESLPQRIFYKDKNLIYVSCNENFARYLHIEPDEIAGKTDYDLYPMKLAEKYRADDRKVMESGRTKDAEERYIEDDQELFLHTIKTPIKDEQDNTVGILGIFWDITEKINLKREAIRNRQLAALGELAAGVAHEINNPINGVINCAQILVNKGNDRDIASRIIKEGDRIATIVSNLLSFARNRDKKEQKTVVNIRDIITDILTLIKPQLQKDGINVKLDVSENLPKIIVHPQQIEQVFINAISNARYALNQKYHGMHPNKILEISGKEMCTNNCLWVKVTFCDRGIGIPAQVLDKVMNPFFTTKPRNQGTGLGLSISHNIIKEHGGKINIDSIEGEFTKVEVILPEKLRIPVEHIQTLGY